MAGFWIPVPDGVALAVRAQPGARRDAVLGIAEAAPRPGWPPARLRAAVTAPPQDGRANAAILRLLARELGVRPAACTLIQGQAARDKMVLVAGAVGASLAALEKRLA